VECLDGDRDARISFTREEFEEVMVAHQIPGKLKATCNEAMKVAQLEPGSLHSVELLGGCSYIPYLRNLVDVTMTLHKPIHSGVRQTMDPLDSVARGCALSAASLLSHSPHVQK
jgi:molecular chaperone DnaK (HSP70)